MDPNSEDQINQKEEIDDYLSDRPIVIITMAFFFEHVSYL